MTPLHFACAYGKVEIVLLLLNDTQNADLLKINTKAIQSGTKYYVTPLHIACQNGFFDIVKLLLSNIRTDCNVKTKPFFINDKDKDSDIMPLHFACQNGYTEIVKLFLKNKKIEIDSKASIKGDIYNALHLASLNGHFKIVDLLLKNSKGLKMLNSQTNVKYYTPLHLSCKYDRYEVASCLIKQPNINLNILDADQYTPLHLACINGTKDIVDIMAHHPQAKVNFAQVLYDLEGIFRFIFFYIMFHFNFAFKRPIINSILMAFFFLKFSYETPLHLACKNNNIDAVKILLSITGIQTKLLDFIFFFNIFFNNDFN